MSLISLRQFARLNGVSAEAISKAVKTGRLPSHDGKLDPTEVQAVWDRIKDPVRAGRKLRPNGTSTALRPASAGPTPTAPVSGSEGRSYSDAKMQREYLRLARDRVELERLIGQVIEVAEIRLQVSAMIANARSRLLALGHRLAPVLALEPDAGHCKALIDAAVDEALGDLARFEGESTTV